MARSIVGLEITQEEVRAVEVSCGKQQKILADGVVRLPQGAAQDSEVLDPVAVVAALHELWQKAKFSSRRVVLGIVSRRVLVRDYRTQAMAPHLLRQALPFQVADLLPVPIDEAVIDFYPIANDGQEVTGLLVAAVAETVTGLVETVTQANLQIEQIDLSPFGLLRAIRVLTDSNESIAVVHVGAHTSYVLVADQGIPKFVRIMSVTLAAATGEAAEQVPSFTDEPVELQDISAEKIEDLTTQVVHTLRFHAERSGSSRISRVLLTGVGAGIPNVRAGLKQRIGVPMNVVGGHHLTKQDGVRSRHGREDLELLTPAGLAMGVSR